MKVTQATLRKFIQEALEERMSDAGKARLDARARIRKMATDLFATADALAEVGLDDLSDRVKRGSKMLRALHQDLGAGRDLGDV